MKIIFLLKPRKLYDFTLSDLKLITLINTLIGSDYSGGGGGGRMAMYHSKENHFTGEYLVHGGYGRSGFGGSGTIYLENQLNATNPVRDLIIDNNGHTKSEQIEESEELDLIYHAGATSGFYTENNILFVSDYNHYNYLYRIIDGSRSTGYISSSKTPTITVTFPHTLFVDHLKVYPQCSSRFDFYYYCLCTTLTCLLALKKTCLLCEDVLV